MGYRFLNKTWSARVKEIEKQAQPQNSTVVQQIKACGYCKTHIPEKEGIYQDHQFFCSYQHLDRYIEHKNNNKLTH
jgi:protein tyrosine phosphatase (PTP) superfamily phosphohydrolase (DUF442 family)